MTEAECAVCHQTWWLMPGECAVSTCPACQAKHERDRKAAEKARRRELRDAARFGVSTANGKSTRIRR
ncbi:hypothetical protein AB0F17_66085 [Nonomuraea sp. NPDC026600]|uniref:hypothetical protein n=1 Tax=Nonomuraea sp. NPDC026600 TaxID=3155363 RepID=UPI0033C74C87